MPALGLAAAVLGTGIPAQAAPAVHYVALGDSYSSGVGAGGTSGSCARSPNAYPALWAKAHSPASFTFAACSGATTGDVINSQLSSLSASTTLVSITIGGNDVGFSRIMETCVLESTRSCQSVIAAAEKYASGTLPGLLKTTLSDIREHAPNAKVIVSDYPDFYDLSAWLCLGLSSADHQALDSGINQLDGVLRTAAAKNGDTFADVRSEFTSHEICSGSDWLHAVTLPLGNSYHPTASGQKGGYLTAFTAAAASVGQ
ncbi:MAG TPA: SGNH/GDSL hydrolase family protein [Trebonia sp.]|nr:SGNH/GDSL hydrolase family protein [Trebonia sp.]